MSDLNMEPQAEVEAPQAEAEPVIPTRELSPGEMAAKGFEAYIKVFKNVADRLSTKQLRKLVKALVEYPLQPENVDFSKEFGRSNDKLLAQAFYIGNKLFDAKHIMLTEIQYMNAMEEMQHRQDEQSTVAPEESNQSSVDEETKEETNNG